MPNDGDLVDLLAEAVEDEALRRRILVDNPTRAPPCPRLQPWAAARLGPRPRRVRWPPHARPRSRPGQRQNDGGWRPGWGGAREGGARRREFQPHAPPRLYWAR